MMNRIWTKNLILALVLLGIAYATYWLEFSKKPQEELEKTSQNSVFSFFQQKKIKTLSVHGNEATYQFDCIKNCSAKETPEFKISSPTQTEADVSHLGSLMSSLKTSQSQSTIDLSSESQDDKTRLLEDYGLASAVVSKQQSRKLKVTYEDGSSEEAYFGNTHPISHLFYVLKAKDEKPVVDHVYLFSASFDKVFANDLTYWRNKKIVEGKAQDYSEVSFKNKNGEVTLKKNETKEWIVNNTYLGETSDIDSFLSGIVFLVTKNFYTKEDRVLKSAEKIAQFHFKPSTEHLKEVTLEFYLKRSKGKPENIYVKSSLKDDIFEVEKNILGTLEKSAQDLRTKRLLTIKEQILTNSFVFSGSTFNNKTIEIVKADGKWIRKEDDKKIDVDQKKMNILLDKISDSNIVKFINKKLTPKGKTLNISIGTPTASNLYQYTIWKDGNQLFALDLKTKRSETLQLKPLLEQSLAWTEAFFKVSEEKVTKK